MRIQETFELICTKQADQLDFDNLPNEIKTAFNGLAFDKKKEDLYRFCILVRFDETKHGRKRDRRRRSYAKVDRMLMHVELPSEELRLLGIHPLTKLDDSPSPSFEGSIKGEVTLPMMAKLEIGGAVKDMVRRNNHAIIAGRTDQTAQWVFLKPFIEANTEYCVSILVSIPKSLAEAERYVQCSASAQDHGRVIKEFRNKRVRLPA